MANVRMSAKATRAVAVKMPNCQLASAKAASKMAPSDDDLQEASSQCVQVICEAEPPVSLLVVFCLQLSSVI